MHNQRGVKVNEMLYWHADFRDPRYAGQKWAVRYDPWDASSVYVLLKDRWVRAQCRNLIGLGQLTELERRALTEEYTHRSGSLNDDRARQRLREFMQVFTPEGAMVAALDRQQENKALYNTLQLSNIRPVQASPKTWLLEETSSQLHDLADEHDTDSTVSDHNPEIHQQEQMDDDLFDFETF